MSQLNLPNRFEGAGTHNPMIILYDSVRYILEKVDCSFEDMIPLTADRVDKYNYRELEFLGYSFIQQLKFLEEKHYTFYSLDLLYCYEVSKPTIENGNREVCAFVYSFFTPQELLQISTNNREFDWSKTPAIRLCNEYMGFFNHIGYVTRYFPLNQKNDLLDPTLEQQNYLPFEYHYKTVYYSLSAIIIKLLSVENLNNIQGTKLHRFIKNCCFGIPSKRIIFL